MLTQIENFTGLFDMSTFVMPFQAKSSDPPSCLILTLSAPLRNNISNSLNELSFSLTSDKHNFFKGMLINYI